MKKNIFLKLSILFSVCLCISLFCCREDETDIDSDNRNEKVHNDTDNQGNEQGNEQGSKEDKTPSQETHLFTEEEMAYANTAAHEDYMSDDEKRMILLCNLARLDGKRFAQEYLTPYLKQKGIDNQYTQSLYSDLEKTKNMPMFTPLKELYDAATYHAEEMIANKQFSHNSPNGESFSTRIKRFVKNTQYVSENISARTSTKDAALDFLVQFLVDENSSELGHRKAIIGQEGRIADKIGVSIKTNSTWEYKYVCVQDFVILQ